MVFVCPVKVWPSYDFILKGTKCKKRECTILRSKKVQLEFSKLPLVDQILNSYLYLRII